MSKGKITVVEDDESILDAVTQILENEGYEVDSVADGTQAIAHMEKNVPNLLLMDIFLIGIDGRDVCLLLKKNKLLSNVPIILMSANNSLKTVGKNVCARDFISKPFSVHDLLTKISKNLIQTKMTPSSSKAYL